MATAASVFREICYSNRDKLLAGIICAGWDRHSGGQVFTIPLGGMCVRQPFSIGGTYLLLLEWNNRDRKLIKSKIGLFFFSLSPLFPAQDPAARTSMDIAMRPSDQICPKRSANNLCLMVCRQHYVRTGGIILYK